MPSASQKIGQTQSSSEVLPSPQLLWTNCSPKNQENSRSHLWNNIWFEVQYQGFWPKLVSWMEHFQFPVDCSFSSDDLTCSFSSESPHVLCLHYPESCPCLPNSGIKRTFWICRLLLVDHLHPPHVVPDHRSTPNPSIDLWNSHQNYHWLLVGWSRKSMHLVAIYSVCLITPPAPRCLYRCDHFESHSVQCITYP